jgi:predicted DNA-binding transcriptional regulator YafY
MRRADRLFQIIQILRSARGPVTARRLADELETTTRTVYRDVADLMAQRVPIRGEAGVGYVLARGYDMPPLMLTPEEIEAAVLGAQWAAARGDAALARGARDLLAKIRDVIPDHLRPMVLHAAVVAPNMKAPEQDGLDMQQVREAIRGRLKLRLNYQDGAGVASERVVWPIFVAYFETVRLITAWCELRRAFRNFRTDRVSVLEVLDARFPVSVETLRRRWADEQGGNCRSTASR